MKKFELCPHDTGAVVLDSISFLNNWREAKKVFKNKGYTGKFLLLENYDNNGNTIIHKINI